MLTLLVRVQPRASRDQVMGPRGDRLKVCLTAPPVEGAANDGLVRFLARELGVAPSRVTVVSGHGAREKRVTVHAPRRCPDWIPPGCPRP
jgi:hypothetical protein